MADSWIQISLVVVRDLMHQYREEKRIRLREEEKEVRWLICLILIRLRRVFPSIAWIDKCFSFSGAPLAIRLWC